MRSFDVSNDRLGLLYGLSQPDGEPNLAPSPFRTQGRVHEPRRPSPVMFDNLKQDHHVSQPVVEKEAPNEQGDTEMKNISRGKFRFKGSSSSTRKTTDESHTRHHKSRSRDQTQEESNSRGSGREGDRSEKRRRHHRSEHGHRSSGHSSRKDKLNYEEKGYSKPKRQAPDDPATYDDTHLPNTQSFKYADPDTAFRESLFDAMADDEGAAFWEGVYGQRIDIYPRPGAEGSTGHLEQMDDDEYATYVRGKMYEKTHEYIFEERLKREKARIADKERKKREQREWESAEKERLRRERARRERDSTKKLKKAWEEYLAAWSQITLERRRDEVLNAASIPWPVASGELKDVDRKTVEEFYLSAPVNLEENGLYNLLKAERVKWHPDKMQQRWGQLGQDVIIGINATFQAIDSMWIERRDKSMKNYSN